MSYASAQIVRISSTHMSVDIAQDVKFQPMTINVDVDSICIRLNSTTRITLDTIVIIPVAPMILPASDTSNI